jgi:hypothetical protein
VPGNHLVIAIDQERSGEPEGLDTGGDLADLFLAMDPRVRGVGLEFFNRPIDNFKHFGWPGSRPLSQVGWRFHKLFLLSKMLQRTGIAPDFGKE